MVLLHDFSILAAFFIIPLYNILSYFSADAYYILPSAFTIVFWRPLQSVWNCWKMIWRSDMASIYPYSAGIRHCSTNKRVVFILVMSDCLPSACCSLFLESSFRPSAFFLLNMIWIYPATGNRFHIVLGFLLSAFFIRSSI